MGSSDRIMNIDTTSDFIDCLTALGAEAKFDIEEGWNHEQTCIQSYTTNRLDWVFAHSRTSSGIDNAIAEDKIIESIQYYTIDGRKITEAPEAGLYIKRRVYNDGSVRCKKKAEVIPLHSEDS